MRIHHEGLMSGPAKKATNLSIRSDLLEQARSLDINLSSEFEKHLAEVIRQRQGEQWLKDNREAIEAYNRHIERDGIWSDGLRTF
jgi:antitoxin CcdA